MVQTVKAVSKPTCRALCYSVADCLSGVGTYRPGTVLQWCRLFKPWWNLPAGHCVTVMQTVQAVLEPTCRELSYSGESCFSNVRTYLPSTVLQWYRLSKQCQNMTAGHCVTVVKAIEPTCLALCCSGTGCLSNVRTYLPGTELQWCRLFKQCPSLPAGHCVTVVKAVLAMSESTCQALWLQAV